MSFVPDSITLPTKVGIQSCIQSTVIPDAVSHPEPVEGHAVLVEPFPGEKYIALRITDPFADPFDLIPKGWQELVKYIKENHIKTECCTPGSCLEEVVIKGCGCYMDVMIKLIS